MISNSDCSPTAFQRHVFALMFLVLIIGLFVPLKSDASTEARSTGSLPQPEQGLAKTGSRIHPVLPVRVYGNSVIPGGVHGASELTSALDRDSSARAHYANFDAANAYVVHVKKAKLVHVSYRMGNDIYWTKKKVRLTKGETLLTDGKSFVRTRCGNRIADFPQLMVSSMEPAPEMLDAVVAVPPDNLASHSVGSGESRAAPTNGIPNNTGNLEVMLTPPLQSSISLPGPRPRQAVVAQTQLPARAGLAAGSPDQVSAAVPALAAAIANELLAVLATTPATQLMPSSLLLPLGSTREVPLALSGPTPSAVAGGNVNNGETVLAALPSTLLDSAVPSPVLMADEIPTKLPEPSSLALLMLALLLFTLLRQRGQGN